MRYLRDRCVSRTAAVFAWMLTALTVASGASAPSKPENAGSYTVQQVLREVELDRPYRALGSRKALAVLDRGNHRILVFDDAGAPRQIGRIGQGNDELYYPGTFTVGPGEKFYVTIMSVPFEVKVLNMQGRRIGGFRSGVTREESKAAVSLDLAVDSDGVVYLNQPYGPALITAYNADGRRLRDFGAKVSSGAVWGAACKTQPRCQDARYERALNRVRMEIANGQLLVAFDRAPILRSYDRKGKLNFERRLDSPVLREVARRQWEDPETWTDLFSYNVDGLQLPLLVNDIAVDPRNQAIFLLIGGREIHVLTSDGRPSRSYLPATGTDRFDSLSITRDGVIYLTSWFGIYEAKLVN